MFDWMKKKAPAPVQSPQSQQSSGQWAQINARFPPHVLFRVPDHPALAKLGDKFSENPTVWADMLKRYPHPPQTDEEAEEREADLWTLYANKFTAKSAAGKLGLKPRQEILDYFENNEKWVFRYYYAATGVVHKTIQEEAVRGMLDWEDTVERAKKIRNRTAAIEFAAPFKDKNNAEMTHLVQEKMPAHFEKWGNNWFLPNIREAFKKLHETPQPEDKNVHGEGGFATRADIDRAARGQTRGVASQQEFED